MNSMKPIRVSNDLMSCGLEFLCKGSELLLGFQQFQCRQQRTIRVSRVLSDLVTCGSTLD